MKLFFWSRVILSLGCVLAFQLVPLRASVNNDAKSSYVQVAEKVASEETISKSSKQEHVQVKLLSEETSIQPGRPFWVGVELNMDNGWDTYWINPGDSGFPTKVDWHLPDGFSAGTLEWPYPQKFVTNSLVAFGYTDKVLLLSQITPPKNLSTDVPITIQANVSWLACNESCVPGSSEVSLSLPVKESLPVVDVDAAAAFSQTRASLPKKLSDVDGKVTITKKAGEIVMKFKPTPGSFGEIDQIQFIPDQSGVIDCTADQTMNIETSGITLNLKTANPSGKIEKLSGVLLFSEHGSSVKKAIQIDGSSIQVLSKIGENGVSSLGMAALFAFLGGLILNVMPCVLPVLALKIFSFVKMAQERRSVILQHGALFSMGVIISFWILSGALLILRSYGESIGWGFQLQEPIFVAILASILFLLGLSLFGLFELGSSFVSLGGKSVVTTSPLKSSFMSGVLATLVATPCTGPMMGPALGFAMTLPALHALSIFTMMGLGMAFPYLVFSAFPNLVRFLPKPGNWMNTFKQLMGLLMMGTVAWLVWVFSAQTDTLMTITLLISFLLLSIGGWVFGRWAAPSKQKMTRIIAIIVASTLLFAGSGSVIFMVKQHKVESQEIAAKEYGWEKYDPVRVQELQDKGVPVFVDFTAKWCLICQANKVPLHSTEVTQAFKDKGVVTMIADWTKKDPIITEQLENLGRSGVPLYVIYPGNPKAAPDILPQTLSGKIIKEHLDNLVRVN